MTRTRRRLFLGMTITVMAAFLIAWAANDELARDPFRPDDLDGLARYLTDHPADWLAASAIADRSLDSEVRERHALWRAAFAHGSRLAPHRPNAAAAFARAGLFHWYELGPADRREVLRVAAPLLRDPRLFANMHRPLWQLTGNLAYLRANAPDTQSALNALRDIAVTNGRFADYRELRAALARKRLETFAAERGRRTPAELIALIPARPTKADEPLVRGVVEELRSRPLAAEKEPIPRGRVRELVDYANRHGIGLEGLESLVGSELSWPRTAIAGDWTGLCGRNEVCNVAAATLTGPAAITVANAQSDEVPPYVEIYVDDALVAEGEIEDSRRFAVIGDRAPHRVEVRLVNPWTRNRFQRRVRLS